MVAQGLDHRPAAELGSGLARRQPDPTPSARSKRSA